MDLTELEPIAKVIIIKTSEGPLKTLHDPVKRFYAKALNLYIRYGTGHGDQA